MPRTDPRSRAEQTIFELEDLRGQAVTVYVTSSIDPSGNRSGIVVGIAYPAGAGGSATSAVVVLDNQCNMITIPVDAILSHELLT